MTRPAQLSALSARAPARLPLLQQPLPRSCAEVRLVVGQAARHLRGLAQVPVPQPGLGQARAWLHAVVEEAAPRRLPAA